jgi:alcohol dehydrogenase, propanol-preferring
VSGIHFVVKNVPIPELEPSQILVRLSVTGVCGADFALAPGEAGPSHDILGHKGVGRVVKLGAGVSPCQVSPVGHASITSVRAARLDV